MTAPTHHTDPQISETALQIARDEQARYYAEAYGFPEVKTRAMALEPARWILLAVERALHQGAQQAYEKVDRALNAEEQFDGSPPQFSGNPFSSLAKNYNGTYRSQRQELPPWALSAEEET